MKTLFVLSLCFICLNIAETHAQQARIVSYNVENLYDTRNDSLTNDDEFSPGGSKYWTYNRFRCKIIHIYQTLVAIGDGEMPAVVGLCEIENRGVLNSLIYDTPLCKFNYKFIHRESPDARGIDVALLYRPDIFQPDSAAWLTVPLPEGESTREILMVKGRLWLSDTVYFFVNHWPSRFGGAGASTSKRLAAAGTLAGMVKEVFLNNCNSNIIAMGDFNDEPGDESLQAIDKILTDGLKDSRFLLTNLSAKTSITDLEGTIKHQGTWSIFDQVLVSPAIIDGSNGCRLVSEKTEIFKAGFLLEPDETYTGYKPFRTYSGPQYNNGFSDHLPVSILVEKKEIVVKD
jgi:hypothetical protein